MHFSPFCHLLLPVLYAPADFASLQSFQVSASILDIVDTVLTTCERNVPEDFALALIADKSPLMALRQSKQDKVNEPGLYPIEILSDDLSMFLRF